MLFWRTKSAKQSESSSTATVENAETAIAATGETIADEVASDPASEPVADISAVKAKVQDAQPVEDTRAASAENDNGDDSESAHHDAKVITLSTVRLADRLADLNGKTERADREVAPAPVADAAIITPSEVRTFGEAVTVMHGQTALRRSLEAHGANAHVLIVGPAGSGRREAALSAAKHVAAARSASNDWIYLSSSLQPGTLQPYAVPHGTAAHIVRDIGDALAKSTAMLARLSASDTHLMSLAVLEEDHRQRSDGGIAQLKRRAEAQNIALVRTSEGFVLAPMHEGRVVRSDVFRSLPDALQRDVESKIATLEGELQQVLAALSDAEIATDDRHLALCQQTAERAIKPNLAMARKLFASAESISGVFEAIERDWTRRATDAIRRGRVDTMLDMPGLQAMSADDHGAATSAGAPVIFAQAVGARDLLGEVGRDANGTLAVRPGLLARAGCGFLIIDAWRLAADPTAWAALSAALETRTITPLSSPGLAVTAEPVPLNANVLIIAERRSAARLRAIDPRFETYFSDAVNFDASAKTITPIGMAL
ncbi:MAG: AAA family ATPase [Hyphomicrobium sp.]|nr:AAA family ATPase [Hyphomicrobium sp.]